MQNGFEIIEKTIGPVIEIEESVRIWRIPATFSRDYKRIMDYLALQGAECVDMPYARYQDIDWELETNRGKLAIFLTIDQAVAFLCRYAEFKASAGRGLARIKGVDNPTLCPCPAPRALSSVWPDLQGAL